MQILLGFIAGAVVGIAVHYLVPGRDTRGVALAPIAGAVIAGIAWTALTWAGLTIENPVLWLSAVIVPAAIVTPAVVVLTRVRIRRDHREQVQRGIA